MSVEFIPCGILGTGSYVPEQVLTNRDLEQIVETTDEWIVTRTGIRERRICAPDQATSDLSVESARRALEASGLKPDQIDMIICCTFTADHTCPSTACLIQRRLGIRREVPAFDLAAACSGFIYGCSVAAGLIRTGTCKHVLVIGTDAMSKILDFEDRNTCVLFGDGSGAAVLGPVEPGRGLLGQCLGADGDGADYIIVPAGGSREPVTETTLQERRQYIQMAGNEVFKFASRVLGKAVRHALSDSGDRLSPSELDLIIPHQANIRIIESASKKLGVPMDRFVVNIDRYGNTSAGTVPIALDEAVREGRLKRGHLFALVAFGGGLTYAASIWRW